MEDNKLLTALCDRAYESTHAWLIENWRRPIGPRESILEKLIHYDDDFYALWRAWTEDEGLGDCDEPIPADEPKLAPIYEAIRRAHLLAEVETPRAYIGQRIAELRRAKGMTQEGLAAAAGVSTPSISRIERGEMSAGIDILGRIASALGTKIDLA